MDVEKRNKLFNFVQPVEYVALKGSMIILGGCEYFV